MFAVSQSRSTHQAYSAGSPSSSPVKGQSCCPALGAVYDATFKILPVYKSEVSTFACLLSGRAALPPKPSQQAPQPVALAWVSHTALSITVFTVLQTHHLCHVDLCMPDLHDASEQ